MLVSPGTLAAEPLVVYAAKKLINQFSSVQCFVITCFVTLVNTELKALTTMLYNYARPRDGTLQSAAGPRACAT